MHVLAQANMWHFQCDYERWAHLASPAKVLEFGGQPLDEGLLAGSGLGDSPQYVSIGGNPLTSKPNFVFFCAKHEDPTEGKYCIVVMGKRAANEWGVKLKRAGYIPSPSPTPPPPFI